jgi:hypothetical protein
MIKIDATEQTECLDLLKAYMILLMSILLMSIPRM